MAGTSEKVKLKDLAIGDQFMFNCIKWTKTRVKLSKGPMPPEEFNVVTDAANGYAAYINPEREVKPIKG